MLIVKQGQIRQFRRELESSLALGL